MTGERIAAAFPVRRIVDGQSCEVPFALTWTPSKTTVGGYLVIDDNRKRTAYYVAELPNDGSYRLWVLKRQDTGDLHHVRFKSLTFACDCRGYTRFGHCRHADALGWLTDEGFLKVRAGLYRAED